MYLNYWNLTRRPFDDGAATDFYVPVESHQSSLLKLRYVVEQRKGLALIASEHGFGKTYLTQVLESELKSETNATFLRLVFPQLSPSGMLAYLARRMGVAVPHSNTDADVLEAIEDRFEELKDEGIHVVVVVDDAHLLEVPHLQTLRLLLNLRENGTGDFSMILCGRTELLSRVQQVAALDQRVAVRTTITSMSPDDVLTYAEHRLSVAGAMSPIFNAESAQAVWEISQGIPRRVNQICDLALLVAYVDQQRTIAAVDVEAAAEELISVAA